MTVSVKIPLALLNFTGGQQKFSLEATTVREVLVRLVEMFPDLADKLTSPQEQGSITVKRGLKIFVNGTDARRLAGPDTVLNPDDKVQLLAAISGG